jgi:uncharacterized protein
MLISPTFGSLSVEQTLQHMKSYMNELPEVQQRIIIGTDSHTTHEATTFVSAAIVHRIGHGARFFIRKISSKPIFDLRLRIYRETELSLELIEQLNGSGLSDLTSRWPLEIHIDIGPAGETKAFIAEIKGWIAAAGYTARIKPESFGASAVADRFTG